MPLTARATAPNPRPRAIGLRRYRPFLLWCAFFLGVWGGLVGVGGFWPETRDNWPIALAMALGSYVAGSTPMGGGTVGFPVLVLLFDQPASMGRQFSFAIQSVGMTSASIFILCSGRRIAWRLLLGSGAVGTLVLPVTLTLLTPLVRDDTVKLVFATLWGSFGVLTLVKLRMLLSDHERPELGPRLDLAAGATVGLVGGVASGLTGVGIDMVLYTALVLLYRADLRVAISTSVLAMAWLSLVGVVSSGVLGTLTEDVFFAWTAAAPVVLFGAPLGALALTVIPRVPTMVFVALLCLAQLVWAVWKIGPSTGVLLGVGIGLVGANAVFHTLFVAGRRLHPDHA
ncbi:MAG: TSUP family transporter [Phycisphaerales bacterium JB040]